MTVIPFNRVERASARREGSPLMSIQEVSELTGFPVSTLRRWHAHGRMPPRTKEGRQFKYKKADIYEGIPLLLDDEIARLTARKNAWWTTLSLLDV
jgi:excisionase family DNA binding protein